MIRLVKTETSDLLKFHVYRGNDVAIVYRSTLKAMEASEVKAYIKWTRMNGWIKSIR